MARHRDERISRSQVEVLDAEAWDAYRSRAAEAIAASGGRYLVRGAVAYERSLANDRSKPGFAK
jgi:uncharacterized protein (DUF1330 family)